MRKSPPLYDRVRQILESARVTVARSVNTTQVVANWLVGREIVEEEQDGKWRAEYGKQILQDLSVRLHGEYGNGYSVDNLELFRRFYREYPVLISDAMPRNSGALKKSDALRRKSGLLSLGRALPPIQHALRDESFSGILHALRGVSWTPGGLHPNLSWMIEYGFGWLPTTSWWTATRRAHIYQDLTDQWWVEVANVEESDFPGVRAKVDSADSARKTGLEYLSSDRLFTAISGVQWITDGRGINHLIPHPPSAAKEGNIASLIPME
jgi:hypothetical protein